MIDPVAFTAMDGSQTKCDLVVLLPDDVIALDFVCPSTLARSLPTESAAVRRKEKKYRSSDLDVPVVAASLEVSGGFGAAFISALKQIATATESDVRALVAAVSRAAQLANGNIIGVARARAGLPRYPIKKTQVPAEPPVDGRVEAEAEAAAVADAQARDRAEAAAEAAVGGGEYGDE